MAIYYKKTNRVTKSLSTLACFKEAYTADYKSLYCKSEGQINVRSNKSQGVEEFQGK